MIKERFYPPYHFVIELLSKVAERFEVLIEEAKKDNSFLTLPARDIFEENREKYKSIKYHVTKGNGELYTVSWKEREDTRRVTVAFDGTRSCTCQMWHQQGVPCEHAMAVAVKNGIGFPDLFKPAYFHRHMLNSTRKEMIAKCKLLTTIPCDYRIKKQIASGPSPGVAYKPLLPYTIQLVPLEDRPAASKKRIRSRGESKSSSNVHARRGKRFVCLSCFQSFSNKSTHKRGSALCKAYLNERPEAEMWRELVRGDDSETEEEEEEEDDSAEADAQATNNSSAVGSDSVSEVDSGEQA